MRVWKVLEEVYNYCQEWNKAKQRHIIVFLSSTVGSFKIEYYNFIMELIYCEIYSFNTHLLRYGPRESLKAGLILLVGIFLGSQDKQAEGQFQFGSMGANLDLTKKGRRQSLPDGFGKNNQIVAKLKNHHSDNI